MAKRVKVGSIVKSKDVSKPDSIQMSGKQAKALAAVLSKVKDDNEKVYINLESKKSQLASLDAAVASGKLSEDYAEKQRGYIEKTPDFVRFELFITDKS